MPQVVTDTLEGAYTALGELEWDLGGYPLAGDGDLGRGMAYDDGLDDVGEVDGDDQDAAGDGSIMAYQRLASRAITLGVSTATGTDDEAFAEIMADLAQVVNLLPDRTNGTRILRWRRNGEVAKRITYRPARGKPLDIPGDEERILYNSAGIVVRLEAADPIIVSDTLHSITFTAGETLNLVNEGTLTAPLPMAWNLTAPGGVTITHDDYPDETITFPSTGSLTVSRTRRITAPGTFGVCHGPDGTLFPRWPLLRPGDNHITASAACTIEWRGTFG